jgi:epoxyqueuosine reductase
MNAASATPWVEARALSLGFSLCRVVRIRDFPELHKIKEWLQRGYAGEMRYLEDARRRDPLRAMPGARNAIVCALNYNTALPDSIKARTAADPAEMRGWIARYAWGGDYHEVMWTKLNDLVAAMRAHFQEPFEARAWSDTGPLHERVFAKYAGLGWIGKNTLLLNQELGSWLFLGAVVTTLDLASTLPPAAAPPADLCGTCRRCLDACPTQAFPEPYVMDARRCISYLTIELRGAIAEELRPSLGSHVFGCDICQDVCPWNRRAPVTAEAEFQPRAFESEASGARDSLFLPRLEWLAGLTEEEFRRVFKNSAVKRTKWRGLIRNACIALGNSLPRAGSQQRERAAALLRRLAASGESVIAESAQWALSRIE